MDDEWKSTRRWNRYIVECKCDSDAQFGKYGCVEIDT